MEIKVMFACGLEYEGQRHRSFTLRLPTLTDVERAIEAAQADAQAGPCAARWAASRPACRPPSPRARTSPIPSWLGPSPTACHMARPATQNARRVVAKWSQSQKKWDTVFCRYPIDFVVVRPAGIEPAAYCLGGNRSIRLSYERASYLVKQSDARCQVEAGGGRSCVSGAEAGCFAPPSRKNPLWGSCRVACDRFRIACAAGAAWGQVRCPWHPAPRRRPPAG